MMIDQYPTDTLSMLIERFVPRLSDGISLYAVLDHSFDPKLLLRLNNQITWISLYQDRGNPDVDVCPVLCQIEASDTTVLQQQLELLLHVTTEQPMLSFWLSSFDRELVFHHFDHYFDVTIQSDNLSYILRYADTRVLPHLIATMDDEQRAHFLYPFNELIYFDRAAQLVHIEPHQTPTSKLLPLILDETQFNTLIDAALPDQILQQFQRLQLMDQLPQQASRAYANTQQLCHAAADFGLTDFGDVMSFCVAQISRNAE